MMTFGSLFAGIGGIDLGLERSGMTCKWQVEINPFCQQVLAKHWPNVKRYADIKLIQSWNLSPVDLIAGGFPCKNTSLASAVHGKRSGLAGPESGLWSHQYRILCAHRPKWAIIENPLGVDSWAPKITRSMEEIGYRVSRVPLSARSVGAPHLRRRLFFVANRDGKGLAIPGGSEPSSTSIDPWGTANRNHWLETLPGVLRVDDGVPGGVDRRERITAVGNAVVPQMAEVIGRLILAAN